FTNQAVDKLGANYLAAFSQYVNDINTHNSGFLNAPEVAYGTPAGHHWAGYDPFGGIDQPVPSGDDPAQTVTSIPSCTGQGDPATLSTPQSWEGSVDLPKSWEILYNLVGYTNDGITPLTTPVCYSNFNDVVTNQVCNFDPDSGNLDCTWDESMSASLDVRFMGTDGLPHSIHHFDIPVDNFSCSSVSGFPNDSTSCPFGNPTDDFSQWLFEHGGSNQSLANMLSNLGGSTQPATRDVLDSEATQIINTETAQAFKWELDAFNDPDVADRSNALYLSDTADLTGALDLLQLVAQTLAPSVSLGNQALSDILYGQDQLPSTIKGPNNAFSIFNNQANGTGTQTFAQYVSQQQGRVAELVSILDGYLASAQQTAAGPAAARSTSSAKVPPVGDLATANAPVLTYSVLAQLATGAKLDTDTVTVNSPGTQTSGLGTAVAKQLTAASSAGAPITSWSATGLPAGLSINSKTGKVTGTPSKTGTFSVTVKATDMVGSSVHNSGQASFSWVVSSKAPPVCGKQLIGNGGFESGISPWSATSGVRLAAASATPAFAGKWLARLGGRTAPRKDTLAQTVTIQPSCSAATLSFELRVISNDPATKASDTMTVQVVSASGKVLKTLVTFSNKNAAAKYAKSSFSLKPFIGQKVTIKFASNETLKGHTTSFLIDNVAVPVS
ncbi:MAG TPA: putative Ig domain-containing protein, partial [Streptosporangiaceae bacterium]|nr:putative Ig domain-containing protein [Streptosporangiaceae bacterium]